MKVRAFAIVLALTVFFVGLYFLLYPKIKTAQENAKAQEAISEFQSFLAEDQPRFVPMELSKAQLFPQLWDACQKYNLSLYEEKQRNMTAEALSKPAVVLSDYDYNSDCFGYIRIPKAGIETPLYLGSSLSNLDKGAAILGQTSLPIGGENTNCVIAGHRSWSGAIKFRDLEQLVVGDEVLITNPWKTLTYEVIETKVIVPDALDEIKIREGCDYLSIFTCTYPNTRRFLVICQRKIV